MVSNANKANLQKSGDIVTFQRITLIIDCYCLIS
jgi:hypothetical protein